MMDFSDFSKLMFSTQNAVLPSPTGMRVALHVFWALALGCATLLIARKLSRDYRLGLTIAVMSWTLLPGAASPAYWLGLAFQTPSLTSAVICLAWLVSRRPWTQGEGILGSSGGPIDVSALWALAGMALGWVLLLDALAWLPVSVYAWGFSSAAFAAVALLLTLIWVVGGRVNGLRDASLMACVLGLFVLTRLPTGNVWDALIDPWLWVGLQACWLFSVVRRLRHAWRGQATTRA